MADKEKGSIGIILGLGKPKAGGEDEGLSESGDELADIIGVSPEKRGAFKSALHAYVKQCAAGGDEPDGDEGHDYEED